MSILLKVDCYSGYKADERPLRFSIGDVPGGQVFEVKEVLDQWYGVGYQCFKVLADDGNFYILRHQRVEDSWVLDSFRSGVPSSVRSPNFDMTLNGASTGRRVARSRRPVH